MVDKYLSNLYGNYMELPPENKRQPHNDKGYRIEYGTNMLSYDYSESMDNVYSDILPYWVGDWQQNQSASTGTAYAIFKNYVHTLNNPYDAKKTEKVNFLGYDFDLHPFDNNDSPALNMAKKLIPIYYIDSNGTKKRYNFTKV